MPIVRKPVGPTHELPDATFTSLATPSSGSENLAVWKVAMTPGIPAAPHALTRGEVLVVTSGRASVKLDAEVEDVAAGDTIIAPPMVPMTISPYGDEPFEALCVVPAGGQVILEGNPFTAPWSV